MGVPVRHVRRFHLARLIGWSVFGVAVVCFGAQGSIPILFFISIAALVESAFSDYMQARQAEETDPTAEM